MQANLQTCEETQNLSLIISGDIDQLTLSKDYWLMASSKVKARLQKASKLRVDLADVVRGDSAGLAWLINLKRDLKQHGVDVTIQNSPAKLIELAKLSNAEQLIE